jgi:hypothetical protein
MSKKVVHFADSVDIEMGSAHCGNRLQGAVHTGNMRDVTYEHCARTLTAKAPAPPPAKGIVHLDGGAEQRTVCGCNVFSVLDSVSQCLSNVTCLDCLRHKIRMDGEGAQKLQLLVEVAQQDIEETRTMANIRFEEIMRLKETVNSLKGVVKNIAQLI